MEWHYAMGQQQLGPVSQMELEKLWREGAIGPQTMVWRAGMVDWQPLAATGLVPPLGSTPPPRPARQAVCVECGGQFAEGDLVSLSGAAICAGCKDRALEKLRSGLPLGGVAWQDGKWLVACQSAVMADSCTKCGQPAGGERMRRKFYWHHPLIYLALLANVLIYVLVALCVRKAVTVELGFCGNCKRRRWLHIAVAWVLVLAGIAVGFAGLAQEALWGFAGVGLFLAGIIWGAVFGPPLRPHRIKDGYAWLGGAHADYLARLPKWTGF